MQISDYLGQYANALASASNTSAAAAPADSRAQSLVSTLAELQEGTVFEGSINSIDGSKILLGLSNGQTISARMDGSVSLLLGQSVFFQVKSNDGNTIAIKPYAGGQAFNPVIQKALQAAGMEMTKDTINMVNRMMEEGMPVDRQALLSMRQTLMQNPRVSMQTAVTMSRLGIPVNDQMAAQFENYQNDRHMMLNQMEQVMDSLPGAYAKLSGSVSSLVQFNQQLLEILENGLPHGTAAGSSEPLSGSILLGELSESLSGSEGLQAEGAIPQPDTASDGQQTAVENGLQGLHGLHGSQADGSQSAQPALFTEAGQAVLNVGGQQVLPKESVQPLPLEESGRPAPLQEFGTDAAHETADAVQTMVSKTEPQVLAENDRQMPLREQETVQVPLQETQSRASMLDAQAAVQEPRQASELLGRHLASELETQLKAVFPEAENLKLNTQLNAKELLDAIVRQLQEHPDDVHREALSKLFSGRAYHALLKDVMEQQWTVRPEEFRTKHKIEELYQRLDRQMGQIEQLAKQAGLNTSQLSRSASDVRSNIDFMNQINQAYTYIQIPLKLANQNAHSELYVYTNRRSLQKKEGELSAFLHLDLEHLGSTDVSIKMLDKNVNTKFYLADDAAYNLIEKHLPKLQERLVQLGYNCNISVENREEKIDFVEDFLQKGQPAKAASRGMVHRYSFDVRA